MDPRGLSIWLIHGTNLFGDPHPELTWTYQFQNYLTENILNVGEQVFVPRWDGGNNKSSREQAAKDITTEIIRPHNNPNDPIRLVGHSHGGNVSVIVTNMLAGEEVKVESLVTIATPVREYQLERDVSVGQHINVYNNSDQVQIRGGQVIRQIAHMIVFGMAIGISANRTFDNAENINAKDAYDLFSPIDSHSSMHSNISIWEKYIEPYFK